jgi:hypothetical protein
MHMTSADYGVFGAGFFAGVLLMAACFAIDGVLRRKH